MGLPEGDRTALRFTDSGHKAEKMGDAGKGGEREDSRGSLMSIPQFCSELPLIPFSAADGFEPSIA